MKEKEMELIAKFIYLAYKQENAEALKEAVIELRMKFQVVQYC